MRFRRSKQTPTPELESFWKEPIRRVDALVFCGGLLVGSLLVGNRLVDKINDEGIRPAVKDAGSETVDMVDQKGASMEDKLDEMIGVAKDIQTKADNMESDVERLKEALKLQGIDIDQIPLDPPQELDAQTETAESAQSTTTVTEQP